MTKKMTDNYQQVLLAFDKHFKQWIATAHPDGDTSALRAIAWFWFSAGNDNAVFRIGQQLRDFQHNLRNGQATENQRFLQDVPSRLENTQ